MRRAPLLSLSLSLSLSLCLSLYAHAFIIIGTSAGTIKAGAGSSGAPPEIPAILQT